MKKFLVLLTLAALALPACKKANEKATEPSVFNVYPKSATSENGFAHKLTIKVTCDVAFEYGLEDGSWITISAGEKDSKNVTPLDLQLSLNDGTAPRKDVLTVSAGSKKMTINITQNTVASGVSVNEIRLKYIFPQDVVLQFPSAWTLSCDASWLEFDPKSGSPDMLTNVSFKATEFNFADEARNAELTISFEGASVKLPVIQESSLPAGDFAQKSYGLYNYNGAGASVVYNPLEHQTNLVKKADESIFRLVSPVGTKMYEISGLPVSYTPADSLHITIYQNWITSMDFRSEKDVWVLKAEDSFVWLIDAEDHGYVVKK